MKRLLYTPNKPDGWLKVLGADGRSGANLENNSAYCGLFN